MIVEVFGDALQHAATQCNTSQTKRNTLEHLATHCNSLQHPATHCITLHHPTTHCNTLQHAATHRNNVVQTHGSHQLLS